MADIALGTYIGTGSTEDGCSCHYTLKLNEKKLFWLDYKKQPPVATAPPEQFHADGSFVISGSGLRCTIGGLPGQGRQGQVWDFEIVLGAMDVKSLKREGISLAPQPDTFGAGDENVVICAACKQRCTGVFSKLGNDAYHKECLVCDTCKQPLGSKFKKTPDGQKLCEACQPKEYCEGCKRAITTGKKIKVGDSVYHDGCFRCEGCDWPLTGGFFKKGGKTLCKDCCDGKPPKPDPPARPDFSDQAPVCPPAAPKVIPAPEKPKKKELLCKLGPYISDELEVKSDKSMPEMTKYSITLLEDNQLWLDKEMKSKIASSKWHCEGEYDETSATTISYKVEACPYGGGPPVGSVLSLQMDPKAGTITFEGVICKFAAGITAVDMKNVSQGAPEKKASEPAPKATAAQKLAPAPAPAQAPKVPEKAAAPAPAPVPAPAPAPAPSPVASGEFLTLAQLQDESVWKPKGINPTEREQALSDAEFQKVFGMDKKSFIEMPKWKKETAKKKNKLY